MADANFQVKKGLTVPKGSESEPSIIFTAADSDTGIYSPAEDQVSIATAGSEVVRVNSSGQIQAVGSGSAAVPIYTFAEDNDTGLFSSGDNKLAVVTSGTERVEFGTGEVVFNDGGENYDFRIEGETNSNLFFVDASASAVGIGINSPGTYNANLAVYSVGGGFSSVLHSNVFGSFPKASAIALGSDAVTYTYSTNGGTVAVTGSAHIAAIQDASAGAGTDIAFINTSSGSVSEKARIDGSGRLLVGTSSSSADTLCIIEGSSAAGAGDGVLYLARGSAPGANGNPLGTLNFSDNGHTPAAQIQAIRDGATYTSGSDQPSALTFSTTADGASSPTERMRITNGGSVNIGSQGTDVIWNQTAVNGVTLSTAGAIQVARSNDTPVLINRNGNDGTLVVFAQAGIQEGDINVSGTTVSYNGAHLSRWSQLPGGAVREEILRGTVLSNIDEMCEWGEEDNEQLNRMKVSDVEGDRNVSGVFQGWDNDDDIYTDDFYCAMTGDFIIRIAGGVTVQRGDLLMSAGNGTAKPQDDDIIRSKTIAKVTSTHVTCTYDDGSYCVPCVLMAC